MKLLVERLSLFPSLCLLAGVFASAAAWAQTSTPGKSNQTTDQSSSTKSRPTYTITDLGEVGLFGSITGLNNHGQVVGYLSPDTGPNANIPSAFLWQDGARTDLGTLGKPGTVANGINDAGQVVGGSTTGHPHPNIQHAFLWQNGKMMDLETTYAYDAQTVARGINNEGQIVGGAIPYIQGVPPRAFLWQGGQKIDLGALNRSGNYSSAYAINDSGQIAGQSYDHAFLWQNGKLLDLGTLGGSGGNGSAAYGINNKGQIVGFAATADGDLSHAFLWRDGKMTDLGTLGGIESWAYGINDTTLVVGGSETGVPPFVGAFLWKDGRMIALNTLVYAASDWALIEARAINNLGHIVGTGSHKGQTRGFLLTPLPQSPGNGKLSLSSNSWTFSPHPVGQTSGAATVYLSNSGSGDLHIQQIRIGALSASDTSSDFNIVHNSCFPTGSPNPITLTPRESCAITFRFTPSLAGGRQADIVVIDDAADGPHVIPINGEGLGKGALVLSQTSWGFGGHPVGQSSGPGVIYVYNSGTEPISFSSIAISGSDAADFVLTSNTCSPSVAPYATCAATVVFTPSAPGAKYATLTFTDDSATSTQSVSLGGDGSRQ